ncbi:protein of unknown function [Burkholderia multivorans]
MRSCPCFHDLLGQDDANASGDVRFDPLLMELRIENSNRRLPQFSFGGLDFRQRV